ncbi:hypothetical protein C7M84_013720 [Penaeus vannamei]|uniref:Uncharacterized protein n=1 Tax=Penaeus vannamei TaxID=6689 RepID=A0A3R7Q486_PENVA|nr:hypothetical protein C7M84_013720 [Penaeus vannamei]
MVCRGLSALSLFSSLSLFPPLPPLLLLSFFRSFLSRPWLLSLYPSSFPPDLPVSPNPPQYPYRCHCALFRLFLPFSPCPRALPRFSLPHSDSLSCFSSLSLPPPPQCPFSNAVPLSHSNKMHSRARTIAVVVEEEDTCTFLVAHPHSFSRFCSSRSHVLRPPRIPRSSPPYPLPRVLLLVIRRSVSFPDRICLGLSILSRTYFFLPPQPSTTPPHLPNATPHPFPLGRQPTAHPSHCVVPHPHLFPIFAQATSPLPIRPPTTVNPLPSLTHHSPSRSSPNHPHTSFPRQPVTTAHPLAQCPLPPHCHVRPFLANPRLTPARACGGLPPKRSGPPHPFLPPFTWPPRPFPLSLHGSPLRASLPLPPNLTSDPPPPLTHTPILVEALATTTVSADKIKVCRMNLSCFLSDPHNSPPLPPCSPPLPPLLSKAANYEAKDKELRR